MRPAACAAKPRAADAARPASEGHKGETFVRMVSDRDRVKDAVAVALVWSAHIGFDRALGYGLKYPEGFAAMHPGRLATGQRHRPRGSAEG
jgi:hypothetical protein